MRETTDGCLINNQVVPKSETAIVAPPAGYAGVFDEKSSSSSMTVERPPAEMAVTMVNGRIGAKGKTNGRKVKGDGKLFNSAGLPPFYKVPNNNVPHKILQTFLTGSFLTTSTMGGSFVATSFSVSSLDQITSLQAVFDQYRIPLIEALLIPRLAANVTGATSNTGLCVTVVDYDDASNLSTVQAGLDYVNALVGSGLDGHYRCFQPHVAVAAYSGTFTSFANEPSPWIDAASPAVAHYGLKVGCTATDTAYTYDLVVRLHTEWRNIR